MLSFIGRSVVQKTITLFFVSIVSFLIIHLAPGKPSQVDPLNPKFTPEVVERFKKEFHIFTRIFLQEKPFPGKTINRFLKRFGNDF
jgi:peptide/nickel transport system permease protein